MFARQLLLSPSGADALDSQGDGVFSDVDWEGIALAGRGARRAWTADTAPRRMTQDASADSDALDRYFAQAADDAEQDGDELAPNS